MIKISNRFLLISSFVSLCLAFQSPLKAMDDLYDGKEKDPQNFRYLKAFKNKETDKEVLNFAKQLWETKDEPIEAINICWDIMIKYKNEKNSLIYMEAEGFLNKKEPEILSLYRKFEEYLKKKRFS